MKFLLTSAGITNKSLANTLRKLNNKPFSKSIIAFIPTAANVENGGMEWMINDLVNLKNLKPKLLDIVDFTALSNKQWLSRIRRADILVFGGGATFYLLKKLKSAGFDKLFIKLLAKKVYVGISAGSMVVGSSFEVNQALEPEKTWEYKGKQGLGIHDFEFIPHLNSKYFPKLTNNHIRQAAKKYSHKIYAFDDKGGLKIDGKNIKVVTEGVSYEYN